jgi:hypothetical protein
MKDQASNIRPYSRGEWDMSKTLMTLAEIALARSISLDEAKRLVERSRPPRIFRSSGTYYLV